MATAPPRGDSHVLREYLVALGFRIDQRGSRNFTNTLTALDKQAQRVGRAVVDIGVAAAAMTTAFVRSMERLFYNSRYADTTVERLQALEAAGRRIGLAGGEMTAGVKSFAAALRANPGLTAMLEKLGVPVKGRTMDEVMIDFVRATKSMPMYVAQQFAEMFGISPEMLFNLQKGLDTIKETQDARAKLIRDMNVDPNQLAETSVKLSNIWRDIVDQAGLFGLAIATELMPEIEKISTATRNLMLDWKGTAEFIRSGGTSASDFWLRMNEGMTGRTFGGGVKLTPEQEARIGTARPPTNNPIEWWRRWREDRDARRKGTRSKAEQDAIDAVQDREDLRRSGRVEGKADAGVDEPGFDPQDYLAALERRYKLPAGLLDRVWRQESSRGQNMLSPKGARGHFGFMPKTQKEYGLKDPDDFVESADAAARKWRDLLREYNGDTRAAAAAYNWGQGNIAKFGLGKAPAETRGYMDAVAGPANVEVNTEVHVHGVRDPERAADSVVRKQRDVAGDVIRNMSPKVR